MTAESVSKQTKSIDLIVNEVSNASELMNESTDKITNGVTDLHDANRQLSQIASFANTFKTNGWRYL